MKILHVMLLIFGQDVNYVYFFYFLFLGIAFLFLRLIDTIYKEGDFNDELTKAVNLILDSSKESTRGKRISFLCGDAGMCQ